MSINDATPAVAAQLARVRLGGDTGHTETPGTREGLTLAYSARPYFPESWAGWRYAPADHYFPGWEADRATVPCPICGAPLGAGCVTRKGKRTPNHDTRSRLARAARP